MNHYIEKRKEEQASAWNKLPPKINWIELFVSSKSRIWHRNKVTDPLTSPSPTQSSRSLSGSIPRLQQHGHICTWFSGNLTPAPHKERCFVRASVKFCSGHSEEQWVFYEVSVICAGTEQSLQSSSPISDLPPHFLYLSAFPLIHSHTLRSMGFAFL